MFAILVDAPADADLFQTLDGLPVTVGPVALWSEDDLLEFLGHFQVLLPESFAAGQARTDGLALALRVKVVHVAGASRVAERLAPVALLVETVAQDGRLARAGHPLLETDVARFRTADGKLAKW